AAMPPAVARTPPRPRTRSKDVCDPRTPTHAPQPTRLDPWTLIHGPRSRGQGPGHADASLGASTHGSAAHPAPAVAGAAMGARGEAGASVRTVRSPPRRRGVRRSRALPAGA